MLKHIVLVGLCLTSAGGMSQAAADLASMKKHAVAGVEARAKLAQEINDSLFSFAELGYQEFETSRYLTALLERNGFEVQHAVAGMPTAWVARWTNGVGGPVIALGSDIDCIPKASQKPGIPWREPLVEGAPGHGEGHNSGQAVNVAAALSVQDVMRRSNVAGTLVLWPGVAEELVGGKAFMVRDGVFRNVDAVIFTHVADNLGVAWGQPRGTGLVSVEYTFQGEAAHSAIAPWRGRSALDAVELMNTAWDKRREHLRPEQRSHYVISDGGDQPNVVPSVASAWYYFREQTFDGIQNSYAIGNRIAEAAAAMTDTTVRRRILGSAAPIHLNKPMAEAANRNIQAIGLPRWTADEQTFAKVVQKNVGSSEEGLATKVAGLRPPPPQPPSGGSDDIGDVSWTVPTIVVGYPANIPGLPGHHWANAIAMATPIAHKGVVAGSKVVAMTTLDLMANEGLRHRAREYFSDVQMQHQRYTPMLGVEDHPAIEMNADTMARYREKLEKFYYDASRYETYLDQLGVKFPTLAKD